MLSIIHLVPLIGMYLRLLFKKIFLRQSVVLKKMYPFKNIDYAIGCGIILLALVLFARFLPGTLRIIFEHNIASA
jgi:hypothetical protein